MPDVPNDAICLFDLDGTLADYDGAMQREFDKLTGVGSDAKGREALRRLISHQPGFWRNLPPYKPGFNILRVARALGFECHVLTKGPRAYSPAWAEKLDWCRTHVPDLNITISQKKSLVYGKVLVDDWPGYYKPWLQVRPRGLVVVPAHAWNDGECDHPNIVRYDGTNTAEVRRRMIAAVESAR